jgi:hypothetical protein
VAHKQIQRIIVFCLLTFVTVCSLLAQDYKSLVGKWNMVSETDGDPVNWTLVLKDNDGKLMAFLATDAGEQQAKDFTYADKVIKFKAPYDGEDYEIELKVTPENKLEGKYSGGGNSGKTTGTKT